MNRLKTTVLSILLPLFAFTQHSEQELQVMLNTWSEDRLVKENTQLMLDGYYYQAGIIADKLITFQPTSSNYHYRRGFIYMEMSGNYIMALPHLRKAVVDTDKNFDNFSPNEQSAPIDAFYQLGHCFHLNEQIDSAEYYYQKFIAVSNPKSEFMMYSQLRLQQCEVARQLFTMPKKATLQNVGGGINTARPEYSPVISLDGSALYFTSRRDWKNGESDEFVDPRFNLPLEDIFVSYRDFDSTWTDPFRLDFCVVDQNEATMAVSPDERRIYCYQDTKGNGDIFYSDFSTNRFQDVEHYRVSRVNTDAWEPHCTVTPDGQTMYFVSDRKGGFGGSDIYRIVKLPNGQWSEPVNCGPTINTPFDEDSPFIAVDNKTLYFSSNGPRSMGGHDVFVSLRDENNVWSDPINLGSPINSTGDDLYYTTTTDGLTGYLTSFRKDGYGEKDIYEIKNDYMGVKNIAVLKGKIKTVNDLPIPEDIAVTLRCTNCGDAFDRKLFPRIRDGVFMSSLEPCRSYDIVFAYEDGVELHRESFETRCIDAYQEVYKEVILDVTKRTVTGINEPPVDTTAIVDTTPKDTIPLHIPDTTVTTDTSAVVVNIDCRDLEFIHYFEYNANKLSYEEGELHDFVKAIEQQLLSGCKAITIRIYSSASTVPTAAFGGSNKVLSEVRAKNMKASLIFYFSNKTTLGDRVKVEIVSSTISGPKYANDYKNRKKYRPYQYVKLKTRS